MYLEVVQKILTRQLGTALMDRQFEIVKASRPVLAPFNGPAELVVFLHKNEKSTVDERSAIVEALVAEAQRKEGPLAMAVLMAAFFPGLLRLYDSIDQTLQLKRRDVEWIVVESFIETVETFPLSTQGRYAVANLLLGTRRVVIGHLRERRPIRAASPIAEVVPTARARW